MRQPGSGAEGVIGASKVMLLFPTLETYSVVHSVLYMLYIVNLMSPSMTTFLVLRLYRSLLAQAIWISTGIALYQPGWVSLMSPPTRKKSVNLSELSSHSLPRGKVGL